MAFGSVGILPSASKSYKQTAVTAALVSAFGVEGRLSCTGSDLVEVWLCLDLDLKPMDCPDTVYPGPRCGSQVWLRPGQEVDAACKAYFPPWLPADGDDDGDGSSDGPAWGMALVLLAALAVAYAGVFLAQRCLAERQAAAALHQPFLQDGRWQALQDP